MVLCKLVNKFIDIFNERIFKRVEVLVLWWFKDFFLGRGGVFLVFYLRIGYILFYWVL